MPDKNWNAVNGEFTPYCPVKSGGKVNHQQLVSEIKEVCDEKQSGGFNQDFCSVASQTHPYTSLILFLTVQLLVNTVHEITIN